MAPKYPMGIPTGGPAFPRAASIDPTDGTLPDGDRLIDAYDGMSLRDYFAAQALVGLLASRDAGPRHDETVRQFRARIARVSYGFADVLLLARDLPHDGPDPQPRAADRDPDVDEQAPHGTERGEQ